MNAVRILGIIGGLGLAGALLWNFYLKSTPLPERTFEQGWYTTTGAARYVGKSRTWIYEQIKSGALRPFVAHGSVRRMFRRRDLDALFTQAR